jgi:uncharacterized protein (TIGR03435 family)
MTSLFTRRIRFYRRNHLLLVAGLLVTAAAASGQGSAAEAAPSPQANPEYKPTLTFDVASVRQSPMADSYMVVGGFAPHTSDLRVTNFTLWNLLNIAYGSGRYHRMVGVPDSLGHAMFNIQAKADEAADEKLAKLSNQQQALEQQHMVQVLLAERFNLKAHWETKEGDVYNLVVKNGSKLQDSKGAPPGADEVKNWGDRPVPPLYQRGDSRTGFDFVAHGCTMEMIVDLLAWQFSRPVIDKTGLGGKYDFTLRYFGTRESDRDAGDTNPLSPLEVAIQEQLGLKLEPAKGPIPTLVIDHIEMPSEN